MVVVCCFFLGGVFILIRSKWPLCAEYGILSSCSNILVPLQIEACWRLLTRRGYWRPSRVLSRECELESGVLEIHYKDWGLLRWYWWLKIVKLHYCSWKKSSTKWHVWNPENNGRFSISTGAGFLASTVTSINTPKFEHGSSQNQRNLGGIRRSRLKTLGWKLLNDEHDWTCILGAKSATSNFKSGEITPFIGVITPVSIHKVIYPAVHCQNLGKSITLGIQSPSRIFISFSDMPLFVWYFIDPSIDPRLSWLGLS